MSGRLTTHVLDTVNGCPAVGLAIELWQINNDANTLLKTLTTNDGGRTDVPFLDNGELSLGIYELRFAIGDYFKRQKNNLPDPAFLDIIPIRFGIADVSSHYHVPLLCSPWAYSTYRGS